VIGEGLGQVGGELGKVGESGQAGGELGKVGKSGQAGEESEQAGEGLGKAEQELRQAG
jgi:hypothetical protein